MPSRPRPTGPGSLSRGLKPAPEIEVIASGPDGRAASGPSGASSGCSRRWLRRRAADRGRGDATKDRDVRNVSRRDQTRRQARQLHELDRHNQQLLIESPFVRQKFMKKLDTKSPEAYAKTVEPYREIFATEVIGRFDLKPLPPNVRSRRGLTTSRSSRATRW